MPAKQTRAVRLTPGDEKALSAVESSGKPGKTPAERRAFNRLRMLRLIGRERGKRDAAYTVTKAGTAAVAQAKERAQAKADTKSAAKG